MLNRTLTITQEATEAEAAPTCSLAGTTSEGCAATTEPGKATDVEREPEEVAPKGNKGEEKV